MRVLLLSRYDRLGASSRLRFYQYLPYLESHGMEVTAAPLLSDEYVRGLYRGDIPKLSVFKSYLARMGRVMRAKQFDVVWVEKEAFPWAPDLIERSFLASPVPLVLDYDDAVFHRYDQHRLTLVRRLLGRKIDAVMRRADLVVVGNDYIGERAKRAGARRVELLPTVVDSARYGVTAPASADRVTIGWIGSPSTAHYLKLIAPALREMMASRGVRVVAVGAHQTQVGDLCIDVRPWSEDAEVEEIRKFDIGIMPLPDSPWERGKCGYKLIQYMACGVPVVASPVGVNKDIVEHGRNGFLAETTKEWIRALRTLQENPDMRRAMGKEGRTKVEQQYCLRVTAPKLVELLKEAAGK